MNKLLDLADHVFSIFFPHLCLACSSVLSNRKLDICLHCQAQLPFTTYHREHENPFTERFWGRIPLQEGAACFYFTKGGKIQAMIHQLKYHQQQAIGFQLGRIYGKKLLLEARWQSVEVIVPVPMHWKKQKLRGYNQAAVIARGVAEGMQKQCLVNALERITYADSQTRKSKMERLQNVDSDFRVCQPDLLSGKHILLVDDVMTSGATLEACAEPILELSNTKISMATLAIAQ